MSLDLNVICAGIIETDMSSVLSALRELAIARKELEKKEEELKDKVKIFLKERNWERYNDPNTKISAVFSKVQTEKVDKDFLKKVLTSQQYSAAVRVVTTERFMIVTPEQRANAKKYIKG